MKRILVAAALSLAAISTPALAANVAVSVSVGQPGFFGQIDIGGYPQPQVIYNQPVMVQPVPVSRPPIYLRVPPGYEAHWGEHCREYNACGERVFFVQHDWYNHEYAPRYQEHHHEHHEERRDERWHDHGDEHREDHDRH